MADGWSELGAMLGGGSQLKQQAYQTGLETGARQASLLEQARQRRDANLAMQAITPQAIQGASSSIDPVTRQPYDPDIRSQMQSELVANMFRAGIDPRQLTEMQKDEQGIDFRNQAWKTATAPSADENLLNRMLMVTAGKPVDLTKIEGNVVLNPTMTPDSQTIAPDQIGLAEIMLKGAQAKASNAQAGASDAQRQRTLAGIGADKASNYDIVDTGNGLVRVNKMDPSDALPVTMAGGVPVHKAGGAGKVSDSQRNAAGFYERMTNSDSELNQLVKDGYNPTNLIDQLTVGGSVLNGLASDSGQQYHQAAQNWVRANLRKESGAAIGKDEMAQEVANYFPKIGDSQAVIKQKAQNRAVVEDAMRTAAGNALQYRTGQVINIAGKAYRVAGGDPSDPDLVPL